MAEAARIDHDPQYSHGLSVVAARLFSGRRGVARRLLIPPSMRRSAVARSPGVRSRPRLPVAPVDSAEAAGAAQLRYVSDAKPPPSPWPRRRPRGKTAISRLSPAEFAVLRLLEARQRLATAG